MKTILVINSGKNHDVFKVSLSGRFCTSKFIICKSSMFNMRNKTQYQRKVLHAYKVKRIGKVFSAGILEQSMGARNRVGIGLSYRPARLHRLAESIPLLLKS
jgi:hypothetical protein